jgi:hypothetical protein
VGQKFQVDEIHTNAARQLFDHLDDEEMLERAHMCAAAAMSIISAVDDDDVFEKAIA